MLPAKPALVLKIFLNAVITRIPRPQADRNQPLKALLFDSWFDDYRGVICLIAVQRWHDQKRRYDHIGTNGQSI